MDSPYNSGELQANSGIARDNRNVLISAPPDGLPGLAFVNCNGMFAQQDNTPRLQREKWATPTFLHSRS